ncbi:hypothetical protein [Methanobrevibacter sp.]|uniref:hypothetical protein n=1 Tax=Methanobrevibacter sp. TaxID=66852 RepID=UPI00388F69CD
MKYSDDLFDVNKDLRFASILGVLCGIASAAGAIYNVEAAYIFVSIPIGNLLALKVDGIHHIITFVVFLILLLIFGIPELNLVILLVCVLATLGDEVGHELIPDRTENKFLNLFFEYRFVLKVAILLLAFLNVFTIWAFVYVVLFDVSYEMAGMAFESLN